jgi:hypothetical protein
MNIGTDLDVFCPDDIEIPPGKEETELEIYALLAQNGGTLLRSTLLI